MAASSAIGWAGVEAGVGAPKEKELASLGVEDSANEVWSKDTEVLLLESSRNENGAVTASFCTDKSAAKGTFML